jgi:hypothetical protein
MLIFTAEKISYYFTGLFNGRSGRAIAHAVSRRFPIAAARIRSQVRSCGICGGKCGIGAGFLRIFRFLLPNFHSTNHSSAFINYPTVEAIQSQNCKCR